MNRVELCASALLLIVYLADVEGVRAQGTAKPATADSTKELFSKVLQSTLGKELNGKEFPFTAERRLKFNLAVVQVEDVVFATGTVHFVEPQEKLKTVVKEIVPSGKQKSRFTLQLTGPVAGSAHGRLASVALESQANFTAQAVVELKGIVEMKTKDLAVLLTPSVSEFKSQVHDLKFDEAWANPAMQPVAEQAVNSWLTEPKTRQQFAATVNKAMKQTVKDEKLKVSLQQLMTK